MLSIEQIVDTINIPDFDRTEFLKYVKYTESNVKTIPPNIKPYYRKLYRRIKTIYDRQFILARL